LVTNQQTEKKSCKLFLARECCFWWVFGEKSAVKKGRLEASGPDRVLYLAVSSIVYDNYFHKGAVQKAIQKYNIKIIVLDIVNQDIIAWM
jgi:hypothetical protein